MRELLYHRSRGRVVAMLVGTSALAMPMAALAQQASTAAPAAPAKSGTTSSASTDSGETDEIIVTGQAVPGAVIGDIPAENQLSQSEIASYGVDSVSDLLDAISDQTASVAGRDSTSGPVVLVNGKRVSGVNEVADLPVESILRVDILPEEVAIKYGYDAQQKVVNLILKRRFQSRVVNLDGGMSTQGGGGETSGTVAYTKIHDNDRLNLIGKVATQAAILESDRDITVNPDLDITEADGIADDREYRTVQPSTRSYTLGGTLAHTISSTANASFNLKGTYKTSRELDGLATGELTDQDDNTFTRYLSDTPLEQLSKTGSLAAGGTVNVDLSKRWKLSVIGSYTHSLSDTRTDTGYDTAALQDAIDAGTVDPYGKLSSSVLGNMQTNHSKSNSDTGSASALIFGKLLPLPAGDISTSLKVGGDYTSQSSSSTRDGDTTSNNAERTNASAKLSIDVPITSASRGVLGAIGTLSLNLNGGLTNVSDYGTLGTFGYGLNWTPRKGISVIAAINEDRSAPTVAQLSDASVTSVNQQIYNYITGATELGNRITGGNPNLKADDRKSFKLGVTAQVLSAPKLNFSATYVDSRNRNAIMALGSVTQQLVDAFPDRYTRDEDGVLTVDARSVNVYRQRTQQVRWGFNFSADLRKATRPARPEGAGGRRWGGQQGDQQGRRQGQGSGASSPQGDDAQGGPPPGEGGDITVTGQREQDGPPGGFPPGGGFGDGPRDGFGRDGGRDGSRDGGPPDGFGGPPGGPGGSGGPGGFGGGPGGPGGPRGFSGGSDNGMRLMGSIYHTWVLQQNVQLTEGGETIDLLHGGTLTGTATPQHKITAQIGLTDNGLGVRLEGNWQSATKISGSSGNSTGDLHFGSLATLDLKIFANLQNRLRGKEWAKGMRVSFSVDNLFNTRQHVTQADGTTPYAYQKDYLDPMGRTVKLSVRKIF